jgi:very-short-patch-repair endonuclease
MATYPVILYPRLIADFRKSSLNAQGSAALNACVTVQGSHRECNQGGGESLSSKRVFVQRVLGSALVLLGASCLPSFIGLVAVVTGLVTVFIPTVQKYLLKRRTKKKEIQKVAYFPPEAPESYKPLQSTALQSYLSMLQATLQGKVLLPNGVTDAPVGASERAFEQVLKKYFPGRVNAQLRIQIPNWDGAYSTDFTVNFPELGVWIDVEIDEPYDYKTGKPTHCTSDDRDRNRNAFFLNNNWIVVRFAEEQVVNFPESCCKEIALVISSVTKLNIYAKSLEAYTSLKPLTMWTQKQAKKMAKANYRDKYLNRQKSKV